MRRMVRLWPVAAAVAAALLAFAAYEQLHPPGTGGRVLGRAIALQERGAPPAVVEHALAEALGSGSPSVRSQAANLLADHLLRHEGKRAVGEAIALYTKAIELDPGDGASKFDLELLLMAQPKKSGKSAEQRPKSARHRASKVESHRSAGGAAPMGSGY